MDITTILTSKQHNPHYLDRYIKFINYCITTSTATTEKLINHHICPKAADMFPAYADLKVHAWNKSVLTHRQHYIAHFLLWKAYGGSQTSAFYAMINKNKYDRRISSKVYHDLKTEAAKRVSELCKGYAMYVDPAGNKVRCKTDDSRVLSGYLRSMSAGRKYKPRTKESRARTSAAVTGKNTGPKSIQHRIRQRKYKEQLDLYYDSYSNEFVNIDPILVEKNHIKVFSGKTRKVWDSCGKFRNIADNIPIPPGYYENNPVKVLKGVLMNSMMYVEYTVYSIPDDFQILSLCKEGKKLVYCTSLHKNVYLPKDFLQNFGLPTNCTHLL